MRKIVESVFDSPEAEHAFFIGIFVYSERLRRAVCL